MARPKHEPKVEVTVQPQENPGQQQVEPVKMTDYAFGLFRDRDGIWKIAKIGFNPANTAVMNFDLVKTENGNVINSFDMIEGFERFKIEMANYLFNRKEV